MEYTLGKVRNQTNAMPGKTQGYASFCRKSSKNPPCPGSDSLLMSLGHAAAGSFIPAQLLSVFLLGIAQDIPRS